MTLHIMMLAALVAVVCFFTNHIIETLALLVALVAVMKMK